MVLRSLFYLHVFSTQTFVHTFCIIYSKVIDGYYVGSTSDEPSERLRRHNSDHKGHTGKATDWGFVHTEQFASKQETMK
ncbi:MAG: GIY-YIG nuclease family protein [Flavobacteriaceae bacterium]|nr:GIY-YIG nuclease family protein [Flavobacteriaceae bacterium]